MGKKTINSHVKQLITSKSCNPKNSFKKYNEIGKGEYGKVYKACINDKCLNKLAVKNSPDNMSAEYIISKKFEKLGVPQVYGYEKCSNRDFLFSEFINGVTLKNFLEKNKKKVTPDELKSIIIQVLYILYTIHNKYPSFRHHDLHLDNVMIMKKRNDTKKEIKIGDTVVEFNDAKLEVKLMDFGLATMRGVINPIVRKSKTFKSDYGIYPESDMAYDYHLFLTSLYATRSPAPAMEKVRNFIMSIFKYKNGVYLLKNSDVVNEFRLRSDVTHSLPTYEEIFKKSYFSKPKNSVMAIINKIKPPVKTIILKPTKKKTPVNQENAKKRAMEFLKSMEAKKKAPPTKKAPSLKKPGLKKPVLMKNPVKPLTVGSSPKK